MNENASEALEMRLRRWVEGLCAIGPRATSIWRGSGGALQNANTLDAARDWLLNEISQLASWNVEVQTFDTPDGPASNVEIRHRDAPSEPANRVLLAGAHYDTWRETPGADDNASAVATLLHMLNALPDDPTVTSGRLRFALFANEEPPNYRSPYMGSLHHARFCKTRGWDVEMLCLESLGYYSDKPGSQQGLSGLDLPEEMADLGEHLLGDVGNFLAFEADTASANLLHRLLAGYDTASAPALRRVAEPLPQELCTGLSDHWSYWQVGFPAVMATDTALFRNPHYHKPSDTPDTLDYPRLAAAALRLTEAVRHAAGATP